MSFQRIFPNVQLPDAAGLGVFIVLGVPPRTHAGGELPLMFGSGCIIRSHTTIYAGNVIGENFQTGHGVMVRESNAIGNNVSIGTQSVIEHHVQIADDVRIHTHVFVPEYTVLEAGCWLGPRVVVTNARYPRSKGVKDRLMGAHIGEGAMVGANATLLPGVKLGKRCLVGAGAVVTKDVADGAVVAGNPAIVINHIANIDLYK